MPSWLQAVGQVLPLTAAVQIVRPLVLGEAPIEAVRPLIVLLVYAGAGYYLALVLTRRRFFR
jgi:lipooligosaccharide transport system permease protein